MKTKKFNWRHGDLCGVQIETLPKGLKASKINVLIARDQSSGGNEHTFKGGIFYHKQEGEYIIGYLKAKGTTLFHAEHGKVIKGKTLREAKIKDGIYELRRQNEHTHEGMRQVQD